MANMSEPFPPRNQGGRAPPPNPSPAPRGIPTSRSTPKFPKPLLAPLPEALPPVNPLGSSSPSPNLLKNPSPPPPGRPARPRRQQTFEPGISPNRNSELGYSSSSDSLSTLGNFNSKPPFLQQRGSLDKERSTRSFSRELTLESRRGNSSRESNGEIIKKLRRTILFQETLSLSESPELPPRNPVPPQTPDLPPPPVPHLPDKPAPPPLPTTTEQSDKRPKFSKTGTMKTAITLTVVYREDSSVAPAQLNLPSTADINYVLTQAIFYFSAAVPAKDFSRHGLFSEELDEYLDSAATLATYKYTPEVPVQLIFKPTPGGMVHSPKDLVNIMAMNLKGDPQGRQPIHLLASDNSIEAKLFQVLMKKKLIDLDQSDLTGKTPLMYASNHHCYSTLNFILSHTKRDVEAKDSSGKTVLHHFFDRNQATLEKKLFNEKEMMIILKKIIDRGAGCFVRDSEGNTPLHWAARGGYIAAILYFVDEKKVHPNLRNYRGENILHCAILSENVDAVRCCVQVGASRFCATIEKEIPEMLAQRCQFSNTFIFQEAKSKKEEDLFHAVDESDYEALKRLLSDESVKSLQKRGKSPLIDALLRAARTSKVELIRWLLTNTPTKPGQTNPSDGSSVLHAVAEASWEGTRKEMEEIVQLVIDKGANVNAKNVFGETPLHLATLAENLPCVQIFLARGAFTNTVNKKGETELHYAVMTCNKRLTGELLKAGSDPSIRNIHGDTVNDLSNRCGLFDVSQVLDNHRRQTILFNKKGVVNKSAEVFQPNIVTITIDKAIIYPPNGEEKLANDVEKPNVFVEVRHRMADRQCTARTICQMKNFEPKWGFETSFVFKKGESYYRDIEFEIFSKDVHLPRMGIQTSGDSKVGRIGIVNFICEAVGKEAINYSLPMVGVSGKTGELFFSLSFSFSAEKRQSLLDGYQHYDAMEQVKSVKKKSGEKRLGRAMYSTGFRPHFPIVIVPGLASSALEAWYTEQGIWKRARVWVDPMKIGQTAGMQKAFSVFTTKKEKKKDKKTKEKEREGEEEEDEDEEQLAESSRKWLKFMMPAADGWSDPPGVKIRAVEGLHGIDYLAESPIAKKQSYVFGHVISLLIDVGYDPTNLLAASYDWRLPPCKLQQRDFYFTRLRDLVRTAHEINGERVVMMGHSMGCRCIQYFLSWLEFHHKGFVEEHIHAFLAIGPPFLGAPKALRAILSGDCMGLEVFLTPEEARTFSRSCGSSPWLFPIHEEQFPDVVSRVIGESSSKGFEAKSTTQLIRGYAQSSYDFFEKYYDADPLYLKTEGRKTSAVLDLPPVPNLWVIMGVNVPTEVSYYYKVEKSKSSEPRISLDQGADKYSHKKDGVFNPRGLQITGGMAFETKSTYQPTVRGNKSGDGTVPFCSLNYARFWKQQAIERGLSLDVQIIEVDGAEHREMLMNEIVLKAIIEFTCKLKNK